MNREEYLNKVIRKIHKFQKSTKYANTPIPNVRISCGLPSHKAFSAKSRTIGQCWSEKCSADQTHEIFISPCISENEIVIATVIHEYCHALVGIKAGHKKHFIDAMHEFGLTGKPTSTYLSESMIPVVQEWIEELGQYPHADLTGKETLEKKQKTYLIKAECPDCGYIIRVTEKWIAMGLPICPCGTEFEAK